MIKGIAYIFIFLFLGESISSILNIPVPGNVIGMILITLSLKFKIIKLEDVKAPADFLVKNMALFFIPPGVGIILYTDMIKNDWIAVIVSLFLGTFAVLIVVGILQQKLEK
jgi:holin-like protein